MLVNQKGYTAAPCIYFTCTIFECGVYKWHHILLFQMFISYYRILWVELFVLSFVFVLYVCPCLIN